MEELSYFLLLVRRDLILWPIITTGSFTYINLKGINHDYWTSQYLEISNYALSEDEKFNKVWVTLTDISTLISFRSSSSKYLDNTKYYFNDDVILDSSNPYFISNLKVSNTRKRLGTYDMDLEMPVHVTVGNSSSYGYYIDITIYKKGWNDKVSNMKD